MVNVLTAGRKFIRRCQWTLESISCELAHGELAEKSDQIPVSGATRLSPREGRWMSWVVAGVVERWRGAERLGGGNVARTEPPNGAQVPTPLGLQPSDVAASEAMFSAKRKSRLVSNKLSGAERPGPL